MSEIKLLPCPFCGGEAKICGYYFIQCTKCGSSTLTHTNREDAINSWNTRKPMQEIVERLEEKYLSHTCDNNEHCDYVEKFGCCYDKAIKQGVKIVKEVGGADEFNK